MDLNVFITFKYSETFLLVKNYPTCHLMGFYEENSASIKGEIRFRDTKHKHTHKIKNKKQTKNPPMVLWRTECRDMLLSKDVPDRTTSALVDCRSRAIFGKPFSFSAISWLIPFDI